MAGAEQSRLSRATDGYDFVVATTQASLNSGLKEFLDKTDQPTTHACLIMNSQGTGLGEALTLDALLQRTDGVNPFTIPHGTSPTDPRIQKLIGARFAVGLQFQIGLPGPPMSLPDVIVLENAATNVIFRLMCSKFAIVVNTPPGGWSEGSWDVYKQSDKVDGKSQTWIFETTVNLRRADLPKNLDTPYYNSHPEEKQAILRALDNLSGTAFSLQQLLFDLDSTIVQKVPEIKGIDRGGPAYEALSKYFRDFYINEAKKNGWPLLGITAVAQENDPSAFALTEYERQVTISKEDPIASTLDNVCVVNHHKMPPKYDFDWNWVTKSQVSQIDGVLSMNRAVLSKVFADQLLELNPEWCCEFSGYFSRSMPPNFGWVVFEPAIPENFSVKPGPDESALQIEYRFDVDSVRETVDFHAEGFVGSELYTLTLSFKQKYVVLEHSISFKIKGVRGYDTKEGELKVVVTDNYELWVDAAGSVRLKQISGTPEVVHRLNPADWEKYKMKTGVQQMVDFAKMIEDTSLIDDGQFRQLQSFVYPGSKVFTFTNARFSNYQDMICDLHYLAPARNKGKSIMEASKGLKIAHSSELMENYLQAEVLTPTGHFEALQSDNENGYGLVFAIDSQGTFFGLQECSGETATGWKRHDLSRLTLQRYFAPEDKAAVRTFGVGQSPIDGTIGMAMGIDSGGIDCLYVSLENSSSNLSWIKNPRWTAVPFDGTLDGKGFRIASIMFSETYYNVQYLTVDIDTGVGGHQIVRYHINLDKPTGPAWVKHDLPIDLEPGTYHSVVGRKRAEKIDGIYTSGSAAGGAQLIYQPVVNLYSEHTSPTPTRLKVPNGVPPTAIATVRNTDNSSNLFETTDLYVIAGRNLYRYPADRQTNDAVGDLLLEEDIFEGTNILYAMQFEGVVTLWGRNADSEVFYVSCYADEVMDPSNWSVPMPILSDASHISPYLNRVDGGNTIFAYTEDRLTCFTQATNTTAKTWKPHHIQLDPVPKPQPEPAKSFMSYTTTITVLDANDQPVDDVKLSLWADSHTPAYINGQYYVLGKKEVQVATDSAGLVTVVEAAEDAYGAILSVCIPQDSETVVINPMDKAFGRVRDLDDANKIRQAAYSANVVAGGTMDDSQRPLIDASTPQQDVDSAAKSIAHFKEAYGEVNPPARTSRLFYRQEAPRVVRRGRGQKGPDNVWSFWSAVGDVFRAVKNAVKKGVEKLIEVIKDAASKTFKFIAKIAGKVYNAVLDAVDAIVGAVVWVFEQIKTAVEIVVRFIQFLFRWEDIKRTKKALHNIAKLYLKHQVGRIDQARVEFGGHLDAVGDKIRDWAGIKDWSSLGAAADSPPDSSGQDALTGHDSSSLLFANHFSRQAKNIQVKSVLPDVNTHAEAEGLIQVLLDAISDQGEVLSRVYQDLQTLASRFKSLSVGEIIKQIAGILGSALVSSVKVVVDALFRVLASLANSALDLLDVKLHIPIISDILNAIGIPDISFMDLFTWIGAVGYTVVYKMINNRAPFPDTSDVRAIISANSWSDLEAIFKSQPASEMDMARSGDKDPFKALSTLQKVVHGAGHGVSGFVLFVATFASSAEALYLTGSNPWGTPSTVLGVIVAALQGGAAYLAPRHPVENTAVNAVSTATTTVGIVSGLLFSGPVQEKLKVSSSKFKGLAVNDGRATSAIVKSVLTIPALFVTGWHFYELSQKSAGQERSAAIIGEVTNIAAYTSTVSYAVAVNLKDPPSKVIPVAIMAAANATAGGLQTARSALVG
ncbi:hypothetical protein E5D57_008022 [Metarhizium anisopliae]|nr:hypothetical protein E5D57_008022 [Metarhizium anisopliae]